MGVSNQQRRPKVKDSPFKVTQKSTNHYLLGTSPTLFVALRKAEGLMCSPGVAVQKAS